MLLFDAKLNQQVSYAVRTNEYPGLEGNDINVDLLYRLPAMISQGFYFYPCYFN